jgi:hypothetical protein
MFMHFRHGLHHGGVFHWFVLAILLALIVTGIVALVRTWNTPRARFRPDPGFPPRGTWAAPAPATDPALVELRTRYARGELSWEEYAQRARNLGFPVVPGPQGDIDPNQPPPPAS